MTNVAQNKKHAPCTALGFFDVGLWEKLFKYEPNLYRFHIVSIEKNLRQFWRDRWLQSVKWPKKIWKGQPVKLSNRRISFRTQQETQNLGAKNVSPLITRTRYECRQAPTNITNLGAGRGIFCCHFMHLAFVVGEALNLSQMCRGYPPASSWKVDGELQKRTGQRTPEPCALGWSQMLTGVHQKTWNSHIQTPHECVFHVTRGMNPFPKFMWFQIYCDIISYVRDI